MPRPEGVTILCQEVYRAKSKETKRERRQRLLNHLVNIYAMSGFRLNGRALTIAQFANVIGAPEDVIQSSLFNKASTMKAFSDPEQLKDTANALASMCTAWAIQDRGLVMSQVEAMMNAQRGKYKPFISAEVRQTLSTLLQSNKQVADIFKTFYQGSGLNINITNQNNTQQANVLTIEKAYEIAKASIPEVQKPADPRKARILPDSSLQALEDQYRLSESEHTIRQFEHLDNSGWERKALIASSPTQQENVDSELQYKVASKLLKREYAQGQDAQGLGNTISDSEYALAEVLDQDSVQVMDNGLDPEADMGLASGGVNAASGSVQAMDMGKVMDKAPDGFQDVVQDGDIRDVTSGFRDGDFGGGLSAPRPESPSGTGTQQRKGLRAPEAPEPNGPTGTQATTVQAPKPLPRKVPKKPAKAQTLSGLKLGSKAPEALEPVNVKALKKAQKGQGSKAPAVSYKQDKMDRHLNPDRRRHIATIDNGELPGRGYQD